MAANCRPIFHPVTYRHRLGQQDLLPNDPIALKKIIIALLETLDANKAITADIQACLKELFSSRRWNLANCPASIKEMAMKDGVLSALDVVDVINDNPVVAGKNTRRAESDFVS